MNFILLLILACSYGLYPSDSECPGASNCWCLWDTGHEYRPPLDDDGHIICDTGEEE
jgi:hypothetical protein